jgi:ABC-type Fe2+-enterobactin transport system substrate-binding protein
MIPTGATKMSEASNAIHQDRIKRWTRTALEDGVEARTMFAIAQRLSDLDALIVTSFQKQYAGIQFESAEDATIATDSFRKQYIDNILRTE